MMVIGAATGAASAERPALTRELLQACLEPPSHDGVGHLASKVGAAAYSALRQKNELKTETTRYHEPGTERDQRTQTTVTSMSGWDLPGPSAGAIEYRETKTEVDYVDHASGEAITAKTTTVSQRCRLAAPVAHAREVFELYERLTDRPYGIRISGDRTWLDIFMFDPDRFDVELMFVLDKPLDGSHVEDADGGLWLVLPDGGERFINDVAPGVPTTTMRRSALLVRLDQTAKMTFINEAITPVVQRLTARAPTQSVQWETPAPGAKAGAE